jgi:hypothetical protein
VHGEMMNAIWGYVREHPGSTHAEIEQALGYTSEDEYEAMRHAIEVMIFGRNLRIHYPDRLHSQVMFLYATDPEADCNPDGTWKQPLEQMIGGGADRPDLT